MYTLRDLCGDEPSLNQTLASVREIGYRYVQVSGIPNADPDTIAASIRANDLMACATHLGWENFLADTSAVVELHELYGTNHSAIGSLPEEYKSGEGIVRFAREAEQVLPTLQRAGLDFSYHNHSHEFAHYGDRTWIDQVYERCAPLGMKFEIDTYWVAAGGADPAEYLNRFSDSLSIVHVKDMIVTPSREQRYAPVGNGNLNWGRIFKMIQAAPVEYVIVEQDAHYDTDPLQNVATSFDFLLQAGFLSI